MEIIFPVAKEFPSPKRLSCSLSLVSRILSATGSGPSERPGRRGWKNHENPEVRRCVRRGGKAHRDGLGETFHWNGHGLSRINAASDRRSVEILCILDHVPLARAQHARQIHRSRRKRIPVEDRDVGALWFVLVRPHIYPHTSGRSWVIRAVRIELGRSCQFVKIALTPL